MRNRSTPARVAAALVIMVAAGGCAGGCAGGSSSPRPIVSGKYQRVTLHTTPNGGQSNEGFSPTGGTGSRVDVYDKFIVVTDHYGVAHVSPHGWYSWLQFKPDARK
jgi:hypothetical protein